jgi:Fe2+ transport system protein B
MSHFTRSLPASCEGCPVPKLVQMGLKKGHWDKIVALAGNPNTGKSTVFNNLTGLRQHTGNWPGKTVTRMEGTVRLNETIYKVVDLPGTYSLLATSEDEAIARDFILFGQPDVTVVVVDATRLERNLNLVFQVLEITDRVVVALNLVDEAQRHGLQINHRRLARELGVPVVPTVARTGKGLAELMQAVEAVASRPRTDRARVHHVPLEDPAFDKAVSELVERLSGRFPGLPNLRWVAIRLLDGDERMVEAVRSGELATVVQHQHGMERAAGVASA